MSTFSQSQALNMRSLAILLCLALAASAQDNDKKPIGDEKKEPVKRGPDGRPLLFGPKIDACKTRKF